MTVYDVFRGNGRKVVKDVDDLKKVPHALHELTPTQRRRLWEIAYHGTLKACHEGHRVTLESLARFGLVVIEADGAYSITDKGRAVLKGDTF